MNRKWVMALGITCFGISFTLFLIQSQLTYNEIPFNDRKDLKEVVFSHTSCAETWRVYLLEMLHDPEIDYENNDVFKKCKKAMEALP